MCRNDRMKMCDSSSLGWRRTFPRTYPLSGLVQECAEPTETLDLIFLGRNGTIFHHPVVYRNIVGV